MTVSTSAVAAPRRATLPDGEQIVLRDVRPDDQQVLRELLDRVTGDSRWMRFFSGAPDIDRAAADEAAADGVRSFGVLALSTDGQVLGHGMCVPTRGRAAEIAFEVADGQHRRGIGGVLFEHLVKRARTAGYRTLVAEVLPTNRDMQDMLGSSGMSMSRELEGGVVHFRVPLGSYAEASAGRSDVGPAHA